MGKNESKIFLGLREQKGEQAPLPRCSSSVTARKDLFSSFRNKVFDSAVYCMPENMVVAPLGGTGALGRYPPPWRL